MSELAGTFDQVTAGIRSLMFAALEGGERDSLRVDFDGFATSGSPQSGTHAWTKPDRPRRFEGVAAMLCGEAFWPAILAVGEHRDAAAELDRATEATRWILRAHTAFSTGHQDALNLCLRRAANVIHDAEAG